MKYPIFAQMNRGWCWIDPGHPEQQRGGFRSRAHAELDYSFMMGLSPIEQLDIPELGDVPSLSETRELMRQTERMAQKIEGEF